MALEKRINFQSSLMVEALIRVQNFALNDSHLMIVGEPGTGKNTMARYCHAQSSRHLFPFIRLNCASMTEDLLDIELFGCEKMTDNGVKIEKTGKIEQADKGILVLDEIGELPLRLQSKLARALKSQEIYKVGSENTLPINLRVISTNYYSLKDKVDQGSFRSDLYYILHAEHIFIPPLRNRPQDIHSFAAYFVEKFSSSLNKKKCPEFEPKAKDFLRKSMWHGNIRELEQLIYKAYFHSETDRITVDVLKKSSLSCSQLNDNIDIKQRKDVLSYVGQTIAEVEKELILKTLESCEGNRTKAALLLGISIRTLRNKLHQYLSHNFSKGSYKNMKTGS